MTSQRASPGIMGNAVQPLIMI